MSEYPDCCANCFNLTAFEYPACFWCYENKECPCNGDETPSFTFSCGKYDRDDESFYAD